MKSEFRVEAGAFYKSRDGGVHGPMAHEVVANVYRSPLNGYWAEDGRWNTGRNHRSNGHPCDLVERVHVLSDAKLKALKRDAGREALGAYSSIEYLHDEDIFSVGFKTKDDGRIVLANWPEGYAIRYHGEIVWRSWKQDEKLATARAAEGVKQIAVNISANITKAVKEIQDEIARCTGVKKEMLGGAADAMPETDSMKPDERKKVAPALSDIVTSAVATVTLGMPWEAYVRAVRKFQGFLMQARVIGASRERALTVLEEEIKKSMANPKAGSNDAVRCAIHRLIEEAYL